MTDDLDALCTCGHVKGDHGDWIGDCYQWLSREKLCSCKQFVNVAPQEGRKA